MNGVTTLISGLVKHPFLQGFSLLDFGVGGSIPPHPSQHLMTSPPLVIYWVRLALGSGWMKIQVPTLWPWKSCATTATKNFCASFPETTETTALGAPSQAVPADLDRPSFCPSVRCWHCRIAFGAQRWPPWGQMVWWSPRKCPSMWASALSSLETVGRVRAGLGRPAFKTLNDYIHSFSGFQLLGTSTKTLKLAFGTWKLRMIGIRCFLSLWGKRT